ncbi:SWI/SNF-related matrix-associated actin-dependent regulator of chromatin subfamily B member 1 isoform X3 [Rhizophagus clarus]|nr:SWI/SNF-related matrix-associated actin-dependent regulator of chromatin subfamily B member 1 isoform X3 [Rhizophagus clarus]
MKVPLQSQQQTAYSYQPQHSYRQQTYQHLVSTPQQYSYNQPRRPAFAPAYYTTSYGSSLPSKSAYAPTNGSFTQAPRRVTRQASETTNMQYNMISKTNSSRKKFYSTYSSRLKQGNTALVLPMIRGGKKRQRGGGHGSLAEDSDDVADLFEDETGNTPPLEKRSANGHATANGDTPVVKRARNRTKHVYNSHKELERNAEQKEILIPIKLDFDIGTHKLRDTFTWNLNEKLITPEHFAEIMCVDLDLPPSEFVTIISDTIRKQIQENEMMTDCNPPKDDSRVLINLDINVGKLSLRDRFEWDLSSDLTPEEFSKTLASDLGIGGEFVTLIAHSIHEQLLKHKKEIKSDDSDNEHEPLKSVFRNIEDVDEWCPVLEILTEEELEKIRLDKERDIRRMRRATSRSIARIRPTRTALQNGLALSPTSRMRSDLKATKLSVEELVHWRCQHCGIDGHNTPLVRKGPDGGKTLCNACGLVWLNKGELPPHRKALFKKDDD